MSLLISTNPAKDYIQVGAVETSTEDEIIDLVKKAQAAKKSWAKIGIDERIKIIQQIVDDFTAKRNELAQLITAETGKSITESHNEFDRYIGFANWYIENGKKAIADSVIENKEDSSTHKIVYEPYGVVAAISPWNFPFGMALWGILPNLLVGNVVILKISEECPLVGKWMGEIIEKCVPDGVFGQVFGSGEAGDFLTDQDIDFIWFTGSTRTGRYLYEKAAKKFIRCTLEMGGSSPCVVFEDADIKKSAQTIYAQRFRNAGQVCTSMKRIIVHESIYDSILAELKTILQSKKVGDPELEDTDIGSLVAKRQSDHLQIQLDDAIKKGASVYYQHPLDTDLSGAFFPPTILTNVNKDMGVWQEEVFGPIVPIVPFQTENEAIELANDTKYGLNARVISGDIEKAKRVAREIDAGTIKINYENSVGYGDPFGGYKLSGIGRENGYEGLRELCQIKVIAHE